MKNVGAENSTSTQDVANVTYVWYDPEIDATIQDMMNSFDDGGKKS